MKFKANLISLILLLCSNAIISIHICSNKKQETTLIQANISQDEEEPVPELSIVSYQIVSKHRKRCIAAGYHGQGGNLVLESCALGRSNQLFRKITHPNGEYQFLSDQTNMVIEVTCARDTEDTPLREWPDENSQHQRFRLEATSEEYFKIVPTHSSQCLDSSAGDYIKQRPCEDREEYEWFLREYKMESPTIGFNSIANLNTGKCVHIQDGVPQVLNCNSEDVAQYFKFFGNQDGSMFIYRDDGLVLTTNGNSIVLEKSQEAHHQAWYLNPITDKSVSLVNRDSNKCLHLTSLDDFASIDLVDCSIDDPNQHFEFTPMILGEVPENGYVSFTHIASEKCLRYTKEKDNIKIHDCIEGNQFQTFKLEPMSNGGYLLVTQILEAVCNSEGANRNNNRVMTWNYDQNQNNVWYIVPMGGKRFQIKSKTNASRCLNAANKTNKGADVITSDCNDNNDFLFEIKTIELSPPETDVFYSLTSATTDSCLTTRFFGTKLQHLPCNMADLAQLFKFTMMDDKSFIIQNYNDGFVDAFNQREIVTHFLNKNNNQRFKIFLINTGVYRFISVGHNDHCITLGNNNEISLSPCNEDDEKQHFVLNKSEYTPDPPGYVSLQVNDKCMKPNFNTLMIDPMDCDNNNGMFAFNLKYYEETGSRRVEHFTNWCLYLNNGNTHDGNEILIYYCLYNSPKEQIFYFNPNTDDTFHMQSAKDPNMCVHMSDKLILKRCNQNEPNQKFKKNPLTFKAIPSGYISIVSKPDSKCVTNQFGTVGHVDCDPEKISNRQGWTFPNNADGSLSIVSNVNLSLASYNDEKVFLQNNEPLYMTQRWHVVPIDEENYNIVHLSSHKCLDYQGEEVKILNCNNSETQMFSLKPVEVLDLRPGWHMLKNSKTGKCLRNILEKKLTYGDCDVNDDSYTFYIILIGDNLTIKNILGKAIEIYGDDNRLVSGENNNWSFYPGFYMNFSIKNQNSGKCIAITDDKTDPYVTECKYTDETQSFEIIQKGKNANPKVLVQIVNVATKQCIKAIKDQDLTQVDCGDQSDSDTFFKVLESIESGYMMVTANKAAINQTHQRVRSNHANKERTQTYLLAPYNGHIMFINLETKGCIQPEGGNYVNKNCELNDNQLFYFAPKLEVVAASE